LECREIILGERIETGGVLFSSQPPAHGPGCSTKPGLVVWISGEGEPAAGCGEAHPAEGRADAGPVDGGI